jgi:hypothetical protein
MHGREIPGNISMSVSVLTMGFWPTYQPVSAILPAEVNIFFFKFLSLTSFLSFTFSFVDYKKYLRNFI